MKNSLFENKSSKTAKLFRSGSEKGSFIIEFLVVIGLIAALTPLVYKQVSDRKEDINDINQANILITLKKETLNYINNYGENLPIGTTVISPTALNLDISGYSIGIKKEADGQINAMIASTDGGDDEKAGKIASLIGVSAGIYSQMDEQKAWGINGVWAEDISNYGFSSLPPGIPVVTTAYETKNNLNMDKVFSAIENHSFERLTSKKYCLDNPNIPEDERCIDEWNLVAINPLEIIAKCNADYNNGVTNSLPCQQGWSKHLNRSCAEISKKYRAVGFDAPSGLYAITTSDNTQVERACYFVKGLLPTNEQLIIGAKTDAIARRYDWENEKISTTCTTIINNWDTAPTGFYSHVTGTNTYNANQPCVFPDTPAATITQCNAANNTIHAACRYGWNKEINRSCEQIISKNDAATSGWYTITTTNSVSRQPCYFIGTNVASKNQTIDQCNTATTGSAMNTNIACRFGYVRGYNPTCAAITDTAPVYTARKGQMNSITTASGGSQECCSCGIPCSAIDFSGVDYYECRDITYGGQTWGWVRSDIVRLNYQQSQTFCENINPSMELKSIEEIQSVGLRGSNSFNPFSRSYWYRTTDPQSQLANWIVFLQSETKSPAALNIVLYNNVNIYALCGPK